MGIICAEMLLLNKAVFFVEAESLGVLTQLGSLVRIDNDLTSFIPQKAKEILIDQLGSY